MSYQAGQKVVVEVNGKYLVGEIRGKPSGPNKKGHLLWNVRYRAKKGRREIWTVKAFSTPRLDHIRKLHRLDTIRYLEILMEMSG